MIVAIDPGKMTGVAWLKNDIINTQAIAYEKRDAFLTRLFELKPTQIIIEDYKIWSVETVRTQIGQPFWSVKWIGIVEYLCNRDKVPLLVVQPAIKQRTTLSEIKAVYNVSAAHTRLVHENDAIKLLSEGIKCLKN